MFLKMFVQRNKGRTSLAFSLFSVVANAFCH